MTIDQAEQLIEIGENIVFILKALAVGVGFILGGMLFDRLRRGMYSKNV